MIDVARIDYWAANGSGPFHRASTLSKVLFLIAVIAAVVITRDPALLAVVYGVLIVVAAASGLPWVTIGFLSLYAAIFAVLYALSLRGGAMIFALLLLKAVTPAYAVGIVITSTPYPRIFSFLGTFLPEILASGLFMTYRTLFILLDMMDNFGTAIRMRGGFSPGNIVKNGSNIAKGIGALLVKAVERTSHLYAVMAVRGYRGSMAEESLGTLGKSDWLPLGMGISLVALVMFWK
jgi:energy-coupling factor transporter transmembrane protein EcfT